jgi:hypothetical protein
LPGGGRAQAADVQEELSGAVEECGRLTAVNRGH